VIGVFVSNAVCK